MITMEEKLKVFTKLVLEKVQNEYDERAREIKEKNNKIIQNHKAKLREKSKQIIQDFVKKGEIEKNRMISKAKLDSKKKILNKREELLNKFIANLEKKARQFTYEEEYKNFLENSVDRVLIGLKDKEHICIYVTDKDRDRYGEIMNRLFVKHDFDSQKISIFTLDSEFIGGVIGIDKEESIKIDCTIKTLIEDNKNLIGQMLYEKLGTLLH